MVSFLAPDLVGKNHDLVERVARGWVFRLESRYFLRHPPANLTVTHA